MPKPEFDHSSASETDDALKGPSTTPPNHSDATEALSREKMSEATLAQGFRDPEESGAVADFQVGGFKILREIGRGGMGIVYLAEDLDLGRKVALKVLPPSFAAAPAARIRFQREAEIASKFDHPQICGILRVGESEGRLWFAMRYVAGRALDEVLSERSRVPHAASSAERSALMTADTSLVEDVARTLAVAHEAGIVHRDLKPGNIMVTEEGRPVVLDFGLAQDLSDSDGPNLTQSGDLLGTPAYMSPEQIRGEAHRADAATDVWALGVMLYEMTTGKRPFEAPTRDALYRQILEQEPKSPRKFQPQISRDLVTVIETALCKEVGGRYATAGDLADDLAAIREIRPIRARRIGVGERALKWARRRPAVAALILLAALTIPALAGMFWSSQQKDADLRRAAGGRLQAAEDALGERRTEAAASALAALDSIELDFERSRRDGLERDLRRLRLRQDAEVLIFDEDADPRGRRAASQLDALEQAFPCDPSAARLRALLALRKGGEKEVSRLLESSPGLASDMKELLAAEDRKAAVELAERSSDPLTAALVLSLRGWPLESLARLELMMEDQPQAHWLAWFAAEQSTRLQDYHAALAHAGRARALIGELTPRQKGRYSVHLRRAGHTDRALSVARAAVAARPSDPLLRYHLASATSDAGDLKAAADIYREALDLDPELAPAWRGLGAVQHDLGRYEVALNAYEEALERAPRDPDTMTNAAATLMNLGRHEDAAKHLEKALSIRPDHAFGLNALGVAYLKRGNFDASIKAHDQALALKPLYPAAHHNRGNALFAKGELAAAIKSFEAALKQDPDLYSAQIKIATIHLKSGRLEEAEAIYRKVIENHEDDEALTNLSVIALQKGQRDEALVLARRAVKAKPGDVNCLRNLASAQMNNGKLPEAIETLAEALDLVPDQEPILVTLAVLNAQQDAEIAVALAAYLKSVESELYVHIEKFVPALETVLLTERPLGLSGKILLARGASSEDGGSESRKADAPTKAELLEQALVARSGRAVAADRLATWVHWYQDEELGGLAAGSKPEEAKVIRHSAKALLSRTLTPGAWPPVESAPK